MSLYTYIRTFIKDKNPDEQFQKFINDIKLDYPRPLKEELGLLEVEQPSGDEIEYLLPSHIPSTNQTRTDTEFDYNDLPDPLDEIDWNPWD
jgi:hypothetical protein